jgi:hypothetical protein
VELQRSAGLSPERVAPADRQDRPHLRAGAAEPRDFSPLGEHSSRAGDHQQVKTDALERFEPGRAGLPEVSPDEAARYIEGRRGDRPWLNSAQHAPADVQRLFAALDQGGGHAHIRHEGWLSMEKSQLRVQFLEDPAQLDSLKKAAGIDGLLAGDKKHYCGAVSTGIRDQTAFAVAFAGGIEHPDVRRALESPPGAGRKPSPVAVPIADLLGPDGHYHCEGYQLAGDDSVTARRNRQTWLRETRAGEPPSVLPPLVVPVDFRGGTIQFRFQINAARTRYEVATMFPDPPKRLPDHS